MTIRTILESDRADWARLRNGLWPGALTDHEAETQAYFDQKLDLPRVFVADLDGRIVGFLELDYRKYAPACVSSPVPFVEGWYVEPGMHGQGIGRALVQAAEAYARREGYDEIASDAEAENVDAIAAHAALGYEEVERAVYFRRRLNGTLT
jgi:aminoglycoside 6'-N-acetyltransferase I